MPQAVGVGNMDYKVPGDFQKFTRWVYLRNHAEYGPFSAMEILGALRDGEISGSTHLRELESGKSMTVEQVKPFADFLKIVEGERARKREKQEFETHRAQIRKSRARGKLALVIGVPAVLCVAVIVALFPQLLGGTGGKVRVVMGGRGTRGAVDQATNKDRNPDVLEQQDPGILEPEAEEELLRKQAAKLAAEQAAERLRSSGEPAELANLERKVERTEVEVKEQPRKRNRSRAKGEADQAAGTRGAAAADEMMVMDFSEDEEDETSEELARQRLATALERCTRQVATHHGDVPDYATTATATLTPSGTLTGLSVTAEPNEYVADLRTCLSGRLLAIEVPPFAGEAVEVRVRAVAR